MNTGTMESRATLTLVLVGFVMGSAFLCIKVLVDYLTVTQLVAGRIGLAAVAIVVVQAARRQTPRLDGRLLLGAAVLVVFDSIVPYLLVAWGSKSIESGEAAVLISTMPLFTALSAGVVSEERFSTRMLVALGVGFVGVALLIGPEALDLRRGVNAGHLAVIGAAACYGATTVYARSLLRTASVMDVTTVKLVAGTAAATAITVVVDGPPSATGFDWRALVALVMLGAVSTGLARLGWLWTVATLGSVRGSLVTYIIPVSALFLGWAVLGEQPAPGTVAGLALIVAGIAGVMGGPFESFARLTSPAEAASGVLQRIFRPASSIAAGSERTIATKA